MEKSLKGLHFVIGLLLVIVLTVKVVDYKFVEARAIQSDPNYIPAAVIEKRLDCLAINIYREAANEPFEGKVGVAQVTLNRTQNENFPDEVCAVVYQKNKFMEKVVCQFSWYCDSAHRTRPIDKKLYDESYEVAKKVMLEGFRLEILDEAIYYHADYINPNWKKHKITKIGHHIFYKDT